MRKVVLRLHIAVVALLAIPVCAQSPKNQQSVPAGPPPKPGALEGSVTNSISHAPIRQAIVSLNGTQGYSYVGQADDGGRFHIANVTPGSYFVGDVRAQGFRYKPANGVISTQINVAEAQDVTGVKLEMEPLGVISGKVVDDDGEAVRDAEVFALAFDYSRGVKMLSARGLAHTDDRGEYRLFDLNPGRYVVRAWLRNAMQAPVGLGAVHRTMPEVGFAPTYYSAGSDPAQATVSEVTPGAEVTGVNFRLRSVPVYHIRGRVTQSSESRGTGLSASECGSSLPSTSPDQFFAPSNANGLFDIAGVTTGTWCVTFNQNGQDGRLYANQTVTVNDRNIEGLAIEPVAMASLPGVVMVDGQSGQQPAFSVTLQRTGGILQGSNAPARDGRFTVSNLVPETYQLTVRGLQQGWYLKSMRYGTQDVSDGLLPLRNDGATLTLVLGTDGGQLSGTVQTESGDQAVNARVIVAPADRYANRRDLLKTLGVDASGHFQAAGLAPGEYKVYAWDDPDVPMWLLTDFRKELSGSATPVTISAGSPTNVQLKTISASEMTKAKAKF